MRRAGSAALDLAYVAAGRLEAFWEFNLNPWDTAAGILLVEEAGGSVTDFAGNPFKLDSREILASNGLIHAELVELFNDMFAGRDLSPIPTPQEFAPAQGCAREDESHGFPHRKTTLNEAASVPVGSCATISVEKFSFPEKSEMAYVIAEPCIGTKDTACVDACPVDCIHPKKDEDGHAEADQLFIDPVECIDCGACVPACPVSAIFAAGRPAGEVGPLYREERYALWPLITLDSIIEALPGAHPATRRMRVCVCLGLWRTPLWAFENAVVTVQVGSKKRDLASRENGFEQKILRLLTALLHQPN